MSTTLCDRDPTFADDGERAAGVATVAQLLGNKCRDLGIRSRRCRPLALPCHGTADEIRSDEDDTGDDRSDTDDGTAPRQVPAGHQSDLEHA
jgi:hypothetical protein